MKQKSNFQKLNLLPKENLLDLNEAKEIKGGVAAVVIIVGTVVIGMSLAFGLGFYAGRISMRKYM